MADIASPSWHVKPRPLVAIGAAVGMLVAASLGLWAYYGTAVFFEMVRAGFAACF